MLKPYSFDADIFYIKWLLPRHQLVGNAAKGVLVTFYTYLAFKLLWCHVGWRSPSAHIFRVRCRQDSSNAKIRQERIPFRIKKDIPWFEVAMHNILPVGVLQSLPDLLEYSNGFIYRHGPTSQLIKAVLQ